MGAKRAPPEERRSPQRPTFPASESAPVRSRRSSSISSQISARRCAAEAKLPWCEARKAALIEPAETPVRIGTLQVGTPVGEEAQDADLVGGTGAAAGENQREIATHGATLAKAAIG